MTSADLGSLELEQGHLEQAQAILEESLAVARDLENKISIVWRLADLGNIYYQQGKIEEFKKYYREGILLAKSLDRNTKRGLLVVALDRLYISRSENSTRILGVIFQLELDVGRPIPPLARRLYINKAQAYVRQVLGNETFESRLAEGRQMAADEALDLVLQMVEEIK
jgi:tetratricopeptide (TPR) repeat protein